MKTHWLIIGCIVVLAVVCVVGYRMSKPDSTAKRQIVHQELKQNADRGKVDKKLASEMPPVREPVMAPVQPLATVPGASNRWATNTIKNRGPAFANPTPFCSGLLPETLSRDSSYHN